MPIVPQAERQETTQPIRQTQLRQPPAGIGRGGEAITEQAIGTLGRAQDIAVKQKNDIDKAMVLEADYRTSMLKSELEVKRNQFQGKDAAGVVQALEEEYRAATSEILKGLANDEQKSAYSNRIQHHWAGPGGLYESSLKYSDSEINKFTDRSYAAVVGLRIRNAIEQAGEPEIYQQSLEELRAIIKDKNPDPAVAETIFNKHVKSIEAGIKERRIEAERILKKEADELKLNANNDLSDLFFDDTLSIGEIEAREDVLGEDYEKWIKTYKKNLEQKEKELKTGKPLKDDPIINADLAVEAMTMPADATAEDISEFRDRVGDQVLKGKLLPATGRSIISDAERVLTLDSARKESEKNVATFLKNDYNNELYGEPGSPEARAEYNRQLTAFRKWSRANLDKDPIEYYEKVSDVHKKSFISKLLGIGKPEVTPQQRREEIQREDKREKAIKELQKKGVPTTESNIEYVMGFM